MFNLITISLAYIFIGWVFATIAILLARNVLDQRIKFVYNKILANRKASNTEVSAEALENEYSRFVFFTTLVWVFGWPAMLTVAILFTIYNLWAHFVLNARNYF